MQDGQAITKNLLGQTEVSHPSPFFCEKRPQFPPMPQEMILRRARNDIYLGAYHYMHVTGAALAQADADIEWLTNKSRWSFKRLFIDDPGTLEQIQQRVADKLSSIEPPVTYDNAILDSIALAGFKAGFEDGKFKVELFAIDAGIFVVEVAAMEVALGPLGGAKFLASAVSKGTKAMRAAFVRLGDIPIFIPGAANGVRGFVRARNVLKALPRYHARKLEAAMFAEARQMGKPLVKLATDETHQRHANLEKRHHRPNSGGRAA